MINHIYQLVSPHFFSVAYSDIDFSKNTIVRPLYMSICQADQRYYRGMRNADTLKNKLPMALIHEACGEVVFDALSNFKIGQKVIMVPNIKNHCPDYLYENYDKNSKFRSSSADGFMQEFISIPSERLVPFENISLPVAAMCELVSVGCHAVSRFITDSHSNKNTIGIWGDGSVAYIVACVLKEMCPDSKIIIMGKDIRKLSYFSFVHETYLLNDIPKNFFVDHAFECAGGEGSSFAIDDIIKYINPQGSIMLLGVCENKIAINTRSILEKGLTFIGCSRSGKIDFEKAVTLLKSPTFQNRLRAIIQEDAPICCINDIHRAFKNDNENLFKTVFKWSV